MDVVELVRRSKGVARTSTLHDRGVSRYGLRQAVDVGATPGSAGGKRGRVHWSRPLIQRDPDVLEDPIENVLAIVAACQPFEEALAIWDSALRQGLVDLETLSRFPWRAKERRLLAETDPFADVGLETYLRTRLKRLRLPLRAQTWIAGHCVDALIGDRLVVQIDGGHHVGEQRTQDNRHDGELKLRGYHVIRIGYHQLVHDWPAVQDLILRAVARRLHLAR